MRLGLTASFIAHGLFGLSGVGLWAAAPTRTTEEVVAIPVELVTLAEITNIAPVTEPEPAPEEIEDEPIDLPIEEEVEEDAPPPVEEDAEIILPDPEEEVEEEKLEEPEPESEKEEIVPEPEPEPLVEKRPEKKEPPRDPLADLLGDDDLFKDLQNKPKKAATRSTNSATKPLEDQRRRRGAGNRTGAEVDVVDFLTSEIKRGKCWRSTKDLPDWERLDVTVKFRLDSNGAISDGPRRTFPTYIDSYDRFYREAVNRALNAITVCAPFKLSPQDYHLWANQDIIITFDESF